MTSTRHSVGISLFLSLAIVIAVSTAARLYHTRTLLTEASAMQTSAIACK